MEPQSAINNLAIRSASQIEKKPVPFRDYYFQIAQIAEVFGVARASIYNLEKEGLLKGKSVKSGASEKKIFGWDDFSIVAGRFKGRFKKPLRNKVKVFANLKGGVGKSTIAVQVAMRASSWGFKTLVIDLDPQAHATLGFGRKYVNEDIYTIWDHWFGDKVSIDKVIIPVTPLLSIIPSNLSLSTLEGTLFLEKNRERFLAKTLAPIRDNWDLIIIDTNPSESNTNTNAILAADEVCIVSATDFLSVDGIKHFFEILNGLISTFQLESLVRVIPNIFDMRDGIAQEALGALRKFYGEYLTKIVVRKNTDLKECHKNEQAIWQYNKKSTGAEDISQLTEELVTELDN